MRRQRLLIILLLLLLAPESRAAEWQRAALEGLSRVLVRAEPIHPDHAFLLPADTLRARVERTLREAGLATVAGSDSTAHPLVPVLEVRVAFAPLTAEPLSGERLGYAYVCGVSFLQAAWPLSRSGRADPGSAPLRTTTWETSVLGVAGTEGVGDEVSRALDERLREFVRDWRAAGGG